MVASLAFSVFEVLTGLMPGYALFLVALVPTGMAMLIFTTAANSGTQLNTAADMRGRVMGLYMLVFLGGTPLGSPLAGWAAQAYGARMSVLAGGVIALAATIVIGYVLARSRGVKMLSNPRPEALARQAA